MRLVVYIYENKYDLRRGRDNRLFVSFVLILAFLSFNKYLLNKFDEKDSRMVVRRI